MSAEGRTVLQIVFWLLYGALSALVCAIGWRRGGSE